jgi:hypothetical protein
LILFYVFLDGTESVFIIDRQIPGFLFIRIVVAIADGIETFLIKLVSSYINQFRRNKTAIKLKDAILTL